VAHAGSLVGTTTTGFIMIEQLKSIDWLARGAALIERVPQDATAL
jgi:hypothetical protein